MHQLLCICNITIIFSLPFKHPQYPHQYQRPNLPLQSQLCGGYTGSMGKALPHSAYAQRPFPTE